MPDKLKNRFLIAAPGMEDSLFARSLILLIEKNADGAFGLVVNRESRFTLTEACEQLGCPAPKREKIFGWGGPVYPTTAFVLHSPQGNWQTTNFFSKDQGIALTLSTDILKELASGAGPEKAMPLLGCAMWEPGQLEKEIQEGFWLNSEVSSHIIFDVALAERYEAALALVGIETLSGESVLSDSVGHA